MSGTNVDLIKEARRVAEEEVGCDTGDGVLYGDLADALEVAEATPPPRVVMDREEWMALPEQSLVRIQFVTRAGIEEAWHVHRISGTGGASSGNAELVGNWAKVWETYRESHHVLAACLTVLYAPKGTK